MELYTADEFQSMVSKAYSEQDRAILLFLYDTGARATEVANLRWKDVDLEDRTANILKSKGKKPRKVPFGKSTEISLRSLLRDMPEPNHPVFISRLHKPYTRSGIRFVVKRSCLRAGVPMRKELVHSIRHTAACNLVEATNGDALYVQKVLGHKKITTTMIYIRHWEDKRVLAKAKTFKSPGDRLAFNAPPPR